MAPEVARTQSLDASPRITALVPPTYSGAAVGHDVVLLAPDTLLGEDGLLVARVALPAVDALHDDALAVDDDADDGIDVLGLAGAVAHRHRVSRRRELACGKVDPGVGVLGDRVQASDPGPRYVRRIERGRRDAQRAPDPGDDEPAARHIGQSLLLVIALARGDDLEVLLSALGVGGIGADVNDYRAQATTWSRISSLFMGVSPGRDRRALEQWMCRRRSSLAARRRAALMRPRTASTRRGLSFDASKTAPTLVEDLQRWLSPAKMGFAAPIEVTRFIERRDPVAVARQV